MVRAVKVDHGEGVWIGTDQGLVRFAAGRLGPVSGFPRVQVLSLAAEPGGGMWIGTAQGLAHWNGRSFEWQTVGDGLPNPVVRAILLDTKGALWVGTGGGLGRLHRGVWSTLSKSGGLPSDEIAALVEDHENNLWIGTVSGGLIRLMEGRVRVLGRRDGLSDEVVYTLAGDSLGNVFAGSESGEVARIERDSERIAVLGSAGARVRTLLPDQAGRLWIGSEQGLYRYASGVIRPWSFPGMPSDSIRTGVETRAGDLWFGTERSGVVRICGGGGRTEVLDLKSGLPGNEVRAIVEDRQGSVWIGTHGGLVRWKDGIQRVYSRADGLAHDYVRCLYEDSDGALWIGTYGGGVSRLREGRFESLSTRQGLASDAIFAIVEDDARNLWMSCNRGVFRVTRRELDAVLDGRRARVEALHLDREDGMVSSECNGGSPGAWKRSDGMLLFPTFRGIVMVDPTRLAEGAPPPPAIIEGVFADGRQFDPSTPGVFPPGTQRVEIRFSAISLRASRRIQFFHRLEGFDRAWVEARANRSAQYTRLPPGEYVFRLSTCSGEGRCSDNGVSYAFRLAPRIYQTIWFGPLVGVASLGLLGLLALWGIRRGAARERQLQRRIHDALAEIKVLSGLIPICAGCKKIREDTGYWTLVEDYLRRYSDVRFSHGLCPDCMRTLYPEYADSVLAENETKSAPPADTAEGAAGSGVAADSNEA